MMDKKLDKLPVDKWAEAYSHWMALLEILEREE